MGLANNIVDRTEQNERSNQFRPSDFLRARRPEKYSNSVFIDVPDLTKTQLEYHLETLTSRNQEREFEYCARKLRG